MARRRALIIGIDGYANEAWKLQGAVRDALSFTSWAVEAGGVAPADIRLLLAPAPEAPPPVLPAGVLAPGPATSQGIVDAIADLADLKEENGGDRLYVYYAGHGALLVNRKPNEPILVPVDYVNPRRHGQLLIGFSQVIPALEAAPFGEQIFFLDACRDFSLTDYEPPLLPPVGAYRPSEGKARQYVLYSVAPGQRAAEAGIGVWTAALLDGLAGHSYRPVSVRGGRYEVRLDRLAEWVRKEVSSKIRNARLREAARFVQTPEYVPDPKGGDPLFVTFTRDTVPLASVSVFVEPALAHDTCKVSVMEYSSGLGEEIEVQSAPKPPAALELPVEFKLRPADYSFRARADRFALATQPWTVDDEPLIELTLEAVAEPQAPPGLETAAVDEAPETTWRGTFGIDDLELGSPGRAVRGEPKPAPARSASLTVQRQDPALRIKLLDARRREVPGTLVPGSPLELYPGIYRVLAWIPGDRPTEKTVEVRPGRPTEAFVSVPAPQLGDLQLQWLQDRGIQADGTAGKRTYLYASELLGPTAGMRLGSLLAYAAYAASHTGPYFTKLRSFGVPPFPERGEQATGVLALVGVAGDWEPGEIDAFLRGCRVALQRTGGESLTGGFSVLSGMPAAAAWQTALDHPGPLQAELSLPGFDATCYALAALPGRLTVLVAVLESDGSVDVQQFLFPLSQSEKPLWRDLLEDPANVRKVDIALRAFAAGEESPLDERDLKDLLAGRWIDPLLACVAGYSLVRAGQPERFLGRLRPGTLERLDLAAPAQGRGLGPSALANLLRLFPGLPDAWVLAGFCDLASQESWFKKAKHCGAPLFAEGLRALGQIGDPPLERVLGRQDFFPGLLTLLLPGSVWSAWTTPVRPMSDPPREEKETP